MDIREQLINKLKKEYEDFKNTVLNSSKEDIYHKHYDICYYEGMARLIYDKTEMDIFLECIADDVIQELLEIDFILEDFSFYFFHYCFTSSMETEDLLQSLSSYISEL